MSQLRSKRLEAIRILAESGRVAADIGCDHAYLSIALIERGAYEWVIAADLREGPLKAAAEHVRTAGLTERIELRRSDGLSEFGAGEADTLILAGMGGALMMKILREGEAVARSAKRLVLQPQSELMEFRQWLRAQGYVIRSEDMVYEDGKYYPMMAVMPEDEHDTATDPLKQQRGSSGSASGPGAVFNGKVTDRREDAQRITAELADAYGGILLLKRHPVLGAYLKEAKALNEKLLTALRRPDTEVSKNAEEGAKDTAPEKKERREARIRELEDEKKRIMEALWFYRN